MPFHFGGGRAGAGRILEAETLRVAHRIDEVQRLLEFGVGFAGKADDEIARQSDIGSHLAHAFEDAQIALRRVAAVHRLEHPVAARLHRQVQERHQLVDLAMRRDQAVCHVCRVAGRVADTGEVGHRGQLANQPVKADPATPVILAMPRIDVLAEQGDLARARIDEPVRLLDKIAERSGDFGAARVGHHAIGAELVATLLHGKESTRPDLAARRQRIELGLRGHVGIGHTLAIDRAGKHVRQAVIGLRADNHLHRRRARHDLLALGLGDAARNRDQRTRAVLAVPILHDPADVGIDLLRRLLADVAGVEHHKVRFLAFRGRRDALRAKQFGHALAVIDVHLAAEALDPIGAGRGNLAHGARR